MVYNTPHETQHHHLRGRRLRLCVVRNGGLMDSTIKGEFEYKLCDYVSLTAYLAYSDYWFDRKLRHGAREYNGSWGHSDKYANSWNFYGGVGVTLSF